MKGGVILKNKFQVTESELEILKVIWKNKQTTSKEIVSELLTTTDWKSKTIHTLISRLVEKDIINVDKSNKKVYIYSPNVSEKEYKKVANESFLNKFYNGSVNLMLSTFIKENNLSKQDIQDLKDLLNDEK